MTRLVVILAIAAGCQSDPQAQSGALRVGFFPTVTHGAALVLLQRGELAHAIAPRAVEPHPFNAGPEAMEALFAGAIDACYVGPMPALNAYLRSRGEALVIVAGAATGGAALVVRKDSGITGPEDLHGKKLSSPQLGNTQDLSLRAYLAAHGLTTNDRGGDVRVMPMAAPDLYSLLRRGDLDGAWVVEPWVSRLVDEAGARILVDEKELWPGGLYPTAVLVVTRKLLREHPELVTQLVRAHVAAVAFIAGHRDQARELAAAALVKYGKKQLPPQVMADAWQRVRFDTALPPGALEKIAADARQLGYLPKTGDVKAAVDVHFLEQLQ